MLVSLSVTPVSVAFGDREFNFWPYFFRPSRQVFMRHMASSGYPECFYDVVPRYGDRCQVQRATCSSYHQTYTSIPFPKHATTIADFALDPSVPHLTSFYAHTCITTQLANKPSPDQRFRTRNPPSIAHIRERPADGIMLSRGNPHQDTRARRERENGKRGSGRTGSVWQDCPR